jgi:para-aminobenzoate synthetase component 1
MIIDLLRNDLGRVCEIGSVRVLAEADIETHPTVLHLVGTIAGRLRENVTCGDLLAAMLPGGSITGCPKIRAMQIIRELEPTPRGAYCGAIGYVGLDGRMGFNVAIRTMQYEPTSAGGGILHLHAGGAITADSDPESEYAETLAKAEGMFRALGHTTAALDAAPAVR